MGESPAHTIAQKRAEIAISAEKFVKAVRKWQDFSATLDRLRKTNI